MKLKPKEPLFAGRTVRESRRLEAEYYKGWAASCGFEDDGGSFPLTSMSDRQLKKLEAKRLKGLPPHGARERKITRYFVREACMEIDRKMLVNAY